MIDRSIRASLRQLNHILDLEILQFSFSDESEGINVVITSTASGLSETQKSEIEDAISIGRILVQCLSEEESVEEVIASTSSFSKRKITEDEEKEIKVFDSEVDIVKANSINLNDEIKAENGNDNAKG